MFKLFALIVIFAVVLSVSAYPAAEEDKKPPQDPLPGKPDDSDLEASDAAAADGTDLKPAETFGFGFYPSVYGYGGRGYGGGYGGWRYSGGYGGWGGYRRGWGYGGYPHGYYW